MKTPQTTLTLRALNRATLARQLLLDRSPLAVQEATGALLGLQSQLPSSPYIALWSRLADFDPQQVSRGLEERKLVRIALMRSTLHLISSQDCRWLRPLLEPVQERAFQATWARLLPGVDQQAVAEAGRAEVELQPRTFQELGEALRERWPQVTAKALAQVVRARVPLVQVPPRGMWGRSGLARHVPLESWVGAGMAKRPSLKTLVLRYLAAFGPASAADAQVWSGLTGLREVFEGLRPQLLSFQGPEGEELFDLPQAPRPEEDTVAPVRFLPDYDNLLFSHADRTRVVSVADKRRLTLKNGTAPSLLLDGVVSADWKLAREKKSVTLTLTAFRRFSAAQQRAAEEEGLRLLAFLEPEREGRVSWAPG